MCFPKLIEDDIAKLGNVANGLDLDKSLPLPREYTNPPALKCIDAVLSIRRDYDKFVTPKLEKFNSKYPNCSLHILLELLNNMSPEAFSQNILEYSREHPDTRRMMILREIVTHLVDAIGECSSIKEEEEALTKWALSKEVSYKVLAIKGVGLATCQYLRMLFGADTVKPDGHIICFVGSTLGRKIYDNEAITYLEKTATRIGIKARILDYAIWKRQKGKRKGHH